MADVDPATPAEPATARPASLTELFIAFSVLCFIAVTGLALVKTRWRTTWGAMADARI